MLREAAGDPELRFPSHNPETHRRPLTAAVVRHGVNQQTSSRRALLDVIRQNFCRLVWTVLENKERERTGRRRKGWERRTSYHYGIGKRKLSFKQVVLDTQPSPKRLSLSETFVQRILPRCTTFLATVKGIAALVKLGTWWLSGSGFPTDLACQKVVRGDPVSPGEHCICHKYESVAKCLNFDPTTTGMLAKAVKKKKWLMTVFHTYEHCSVPWSHVQNSDTWPLTHSYDSCSFPGVM